MASDRPRAAKREAPPFQRSGRHHKKPETLQNAAEVRDKRTSKKKGKTDKKERVQEDPKARSKHYGSCERRKRKVVITEQSILTFELCVKNQGLSQGTVFDFLLKEEVA